MKTRVICEHCGREQTIDETALRMSPVHKILCSGCSQWSKPTRASKLGKTDNQRRSQDQEKRAAKRYGGRRQAGSGSSHRAKGDFVAEGKIRGECKFTRAKSFSVKLEELLKIEKEASGMEMPLFEVEFQGVFPHKRYVVIRSEDYEALKDAQERF